MASNGIAFVAFIFAFTVVLLTNSVHKVNEGYVGVYWRGGALVNRITHPGFHFKVPFLDQFEVVQTTVQTDKVMNIPCGTSGGVLIDIERVEVVNRLREEYVYQTIKNYTVDYDRIWIFDKIHHEINQFCSKHSLQDVYIDLFHTVDERLQQALQEACDLWAPGIEIIAIRITKPRIPAAILKNYEQMEAEKTRLLATAQAQKVVEKEEETRQKQATIAAETEAKVSRIQNDRKVSEVEAMKTIRKLEDDALLYHEKILTDAQFYKVQKAAEANQLLLTPEYLQLELVKSVANTTKVYFGPSMSSLFLELTDLLTNKQISKP